MVRNQRIDWSKLRNPMAITHTDWNDLKEGGKEKSYLFEKQLLEIMDIIENDFAKTNGEANPRSKNIAIIGERGSGKTSILESLKNILQGENYYVFDIVSPLILNKKLNILEILLSYIYTSINKGNNGNVSESDYIDKSKINQQLKEIIQTLSEERQSAAYFEKDHPSIELLDDINNRVVLDQKLMSLLDSFNSFLQKRRDNPEGSVKDFVLIIDDLDLLENDAIKEIIDSIQKYLDGKMIIIFAYRARQLEDSIIDDKLKVNSKLMEKGLVNIDELNRQSSAMLEKLLPVNQRIFLYSKEEILNMELEKITEELYKGHEKKPEDKQMTEDWIYNSIFEKTGLYIKPVDTRENTYHFLPTSIRGILQFVEMIENRMKDLDYNIGETDRRLEKRWETMLENLNIFEEYFRDTAFDYLKKEDVNFLEEWYLQNSYSKNHLSYQYFYNLIPAEDIEVRNRNYPLNLSKYEAHNLTLGDTHAMIDYYSSNYAKTSIDFFKVYVMKVVYSIELLKCLLSYMVYSINIPYEIYENTKVDAKKMEEENKKGIEMAEENLKAYLQLINTNIMPSDYEYLNFSTDRQKDNYIIVYYKDSEQIKLNDENEVKLEAEKKTNENKKMIDVDELKKRIDGEELDRLFDKMVNSDRSSYGEIIGGIEQGKYPFKYRELYNYKELELISKWKYSFDFFVFPTKEKYVKNAVKEYLFYNENSEEELPYLFYNSFQIDALRRGVYSRRSEKETYKYATESINDLLSGGNKNKEARERYIKYLMTNLVNKNNLKNEEGDNIIKYKKPYDKEAELIVLIREYIKEVENSKK